MAGFLPIIFVLFLGVLGCVDKELALAASLITLGIILTVSLVGGLVYVCYQPAILKK